MLASNKTIILRIMCKNSYNLADLLLLGKFAVLEISLAAPIIVNIEPLSSFSNYLVFFQNKAGGIELFVKIELWCDLMVDLLVSRWQREYLFSLGHRRVESSLGFVMQTSTGRMENRWVSHHLPEHEGDCLLNVFFPILKPN